MRAAVESHHSNSSSRVNQLPIGSSNASTALAWFLPSPSWSLLLIEVQKEACNPQKLFPWVPVVRVASPLGSDWRSSSPASARSGNPSFRSSIINLAVAPCCHADLNSCTLRRPIHWWWRTLLPITALIPVLSPLKLNHSVLNLSSFFPVRPGLNPVPIPLEIHPGHLPPFFTPFATCLHSNGVEQRSKSSYRSPSCRPGEPRCRTAVMFR